MVYTLLWLICIEYFLPLVISLSQWVSPSGFLPERKFLDLSRILQLVILWTPNSALWEWWNCWTLFSGLSPQDIFVCLFSYDLVLHTSSIGVQKVLKMKCIRKFSHTSLEFPFEAWVPWKFWTPVRLAQASATTFSLDSNLEAAPWQKSWWKCGVGYGCHSGTHPFSLEFQTL